MERKISQELRLAEHLLEDARFLLERESLRSCVNRAYYAAYHATRALLATEGINPRTHGGVLNQFGERFIKTKKMDMAFSDALKRCFDARHEADYDIFATFEKDEVEELIREVEGLIEEIKSMLSNE